MNEKTSEHSVVYLRIVEPNDLPAVVALEEQSFTDPYPKSVLTMLSKQYAETFVVAVHRSTIVGYAVIAPGADRHHLLSIAVEPSRRRMGLGKEMLVFLESRIGSGTIVLELRKSNVTAFDFYKNNGFLETGTMPNYYRDGEDAITMKRIFVQTSRQRSTMNSSGSSGNRDASQVN
jgi:ribosomal-protein-alanine N-acetyltransferase